jgi:hypothetical protein
MRTWIVLLCLLPVVPAFAQDAPVASPVPQALTESERCSVDSLAQRATIVALRAELAKLTARVAELEAPLVQQAVQKERTELEQRFRARLKPADSSTFDWQTLTFIAPAAVPQK